MILIDIPMPNSCLTCPLCFHVEVEGEHFLDSYKECSLLKTTVPYEFYGRLETCSLIEEKIGYHSY